GIPWHGVIHLQHKELTGLRASFSHWQLRRVLAQRIGPEYASGRGLFRETWRLLAHLVGAKSESRMTESWLAEAKVLPSFVAEFARIPLSPRRNSCEFCYEDPLGALAVGHRPPAALFLHSPLAMPSCERDNRPVSPVHGRGVFGGMARGEEKEEAPARRWTRRSTATQPGCRPAAWRRPGPGGRAHGPPPLGGGPRPAPATGPDVPSTRGNLARAGRGGRG